MKLLLLTPEFEGSGGGIFTYYQFLIPLLQAEGVEARVIEGSACYLGENKSRREWNGVRVETLEAARVRRWHARFGHLAATPLLRRHLAAAWAMWEQVDFGEGADIVEACDWGMLFVPPAIEGKHPLIAQCHGSIGQLDQHDPIVGEETYGVVMRLLEGAVLARASAIQTSSCANATYWRTQTGGNVAPMWPAWARPALPPAEAVGNRGLVVGRVQRWKGPQVLCEAIGLMGHKAPQIEWIGRDTPWKRPGSSTIARLASAYPGSWGNKIVHHDPVPPREVLSRQAGALFNLVPSTWDVFNFTAVEAMSSGRPTIVSKGAGASELVQDGVNGYAFPAGDAEGLAGAIDRVLSENPARLAELGRAAQATIRRALDPATIAAERIAAYQSAIDAFRNRRGHALHGSLDEICRPTDRLLEDDVTFLHHVALRKLLKHVVRRIGDRAGLLSRS